MPRESRSQRFLFDPNAVTRDPAFRAMSLKARGAYSALWPELWWEREPGVVANDENVLARLAQCTLEEWRDVTGDVSRAFDVTRDGVWICTFMQRTFLEQNERQDKWRKRQRDKRKRERDITGDIGVTSPLGSGSGSGSGTQKPPESPPLAKNRTTPKRTPVLTISSEQREAACDRYHLDRETVDSLADRIELEAQAGKYVSAPGALHTYCRNEVRFRSERGNGYVEPPSPWPDEVSR